MRRSAVSIPSNIAEGHGRLTDRGFRVFLAQARGSLFELETQLELAANIGFCPTNQASTMAMHCCEVAKILNGIIAKLDTKNESTHLS